MLVNLLAFAGVKDALGTGQRSLDMKPGATIEDLIERLCESSPELMDLKVSLRAALDQEFVPLDTPLFAGCELALFTPVGGG